MLTQTFIKLINEPIYLMRSLIIFRTVIINAILPFVIYLRGHWEGMLIMPFKNSGKKYKYKAVSVFLSISVCCSSLGLINVRADDPTQFLKGDATANFVLNNIDYIDIRGSQPWSAPAIYETGALNIMKGYGSQLFAKDDVVTREQAIAIAIRLSGNEAKAKQAADTLDAARTNKIKDPILYWSLGYLKIAADNGLISKTEYQASVNSNGTQGFDGQAPVQRQEMAYWIALAMKLPPKYDDQAILNNFNDWRQCDPEKLAYIEATLQSRIMNGDDNGSFLPRGPVTREQAAQIGKNAESFLLPIMKLTKKSGTIEELKPEIKTVNGVKTNLVNFYVRNLDGSLTSIASSFSANPWDYRNKELTGLPTDSNNAELVVHKDGNVGGASLLTSGDRIEYIYDATGTVKYVNVVSSSSSTKYMVGQLKGIDTKAATVSIDSFFQSETSDIDLSSQYANLNSSGILQTYSYSRDAKFIVDGISGDPSKLSNNDFVIATVVNDTVTKLQKYNPSYRPGESGIVSGTVQDNNPQLGYITLYGQDGTGVGANPITSDIFRNYNYASLNSVVVYRDHKEATPGDIKPGDTVFLRLDKDGRVTQISAASNYTIKYGVVTSISNSSVGIKFDDGTQQNIETGDSTKWFGADGSSGMENVREGDNVVLTLNISAAGTDAVEVRASNIFSNVNNTYKASLEGYRKDTNSVLISDVKTFTKKSFDWISDIGIKKIKLSDNCKVYIDGIPVSADKLSDTDKLSTTYVVTKNAFGDDEKAILIAVNTQQTSNMPNYNDSLMKLDTLNQTVTLQNYQTSLPVKDETIIIRDNRLVNLNSLKTDDRINIATGSYKGVNGSYAAIIIAGEPVNSGYFEVYRGRIGSINDGTDFTVKSYSQLDDNIFKYYNTPKTFDITSRTRLAGDTGPVAMRSFTDSSFADIPVFVVSKAGEALYISTVPFNNIYCYKAEITNVSGLALGLKDGRVFNTVTYEWNPSTVSLVTLLNNTIIIKGEKIVKPEELSKGDKIKLFKQGNTATGNAYIVIVEE